VAKESKPRRARYVWAGCALVVLMVLVLGFLVRVSVTSEVPVAYQSTSAVLVPVTSAVGRSYLATFPTAIARVTSSESSATLTQTSAATEQVLVMTHTTLLCNESVYVRSFLAAGSRVHVSWNATGKVDVYVLNFSQFTDYMGNDTDEGIGETIGSWTANQSGASNGGLSFSVPVADSYFFLIFNPSMRGACVGPIGITSAGGEAVYPTYLTSPSTKWVTYTSTSLSLAERTLTTTVTSTQTSTESIPLTLTSTSTTHCAPSFWAWLFGSRAC